MIRSRLISLLGTFVLFFVLLFGVSDAAPPLILDVTTNNNIIAYNEVASFNLEITNNQNFSDIIKIRVPSDGWDVNAVDYILDLRPGESKNATVHIGPPKDVAVGTYSVRIQFESLISNEIIDYKYLHVTVNKAAEPEPEPIIAPEPVPEPITKVVIDKQFAKDFLKKNWIITISNEGETTVVQSWSSDLTPLDAFLVDSKPQQSRVEKFNGNPVLVWDYNLAPGEVFIISYSVNYFPVLTSIILILASVILLGWFYKTDMSINKKILVSRGPVKGIKIKLHVVNKTGNEKQNVIVADSIPTPLSLVREFGTMKPTIIKLRKRKTDIVWKIPKLAPHEERVLSYLVKSRIHVIGKLILPAAVVKWRGKKNKVKNAYSGSIAIRGKAEKIIEVDEFKPKK